MNKEYWIDADGYLVCGVRKENDWESVAEIPQKHVEPIAKLLLYQYNSIPPKPQHGREPEFVKSLAQYLDEYIQYEVENGNIRPAVSDLFAYDSWRELFEQAFDAYQSTENVTIKIERK